MFDDISLYRLLYLHKGYHPPSNHDSDINIQEFLTLLYESLMRRDFDFVVNNIDNVLNLGMEHLELQTMTFLLTHLYSVTENLVSFDAEFVFNLTKDFLLLALRAPSVITTFTPSRIVYTALQALFQNDSALSLDLINEIYGDFFHNYDDKLTAIYATLQEGEHTKDIAIMSSRITYSKKRLANSILVKELRSNLELALVSMYIAYTQVIPLETPEPFSFKSTLKTLTLHEFSMNKKLKKRCFVEFMNYYPQENRLSTQLLTTLFSVVVEALSATQNLDTSWFFCSNGVLNHVERPFYSKEIDRTNHLEGFKVRFSSSKSAFSNSVRKVVSVSKNIPTGLKYFTGIIKQIPRKKHLTSYKITHYSELLSPTMSYNFPELLDIFVLVSLLMDKEVLCRELLLSIIKFYPTHTVPRICYHNLANFKNKMGKDEKDANIQAIFQADPLNDSFANLVTISELDHVDKALIRLSYLDKQGRHSEFSTLLHKVVLFLQQQVYSSVVSLPQRQVGWDPDWSPQDFYTRNDDWDIFIDRLPFYPSFFKMLAFDESSQELIDAIAENTQSLTQYHLKLTPTDSYTTFAQSQSWNFTPDTLIDLAFINFIYCGRNNFTTNVILSALTESSNFEPNHKNILKSYGVIEHPPIFKKFSAGKNLFKVNKK